MAYQFETVKLEKGMYNEAGRSFTKVLEKCDPSEQYQGTPRKSWTPSSGS